MDSVGFGSHWGQRDGGGLGGGEENFPTPPPLFTQEGRRGAGRIGGGRRPTAREGGSGRLGTGNFPPARRGKGVRAGVERPPPTLTSTV